MLDGLLFGFIDNGVLAICALLGIDLDKKFAGKGINGALYGALFGNALSDGIGAILDFGWLIKKDGPICSYSDNKYRAIVSLSANDVIPYGLSFF